MLKRFSNTHQFSVETFPSDSGLLTKHRSIPTPFQRQPVILFTYIHVVYNLLHIHVYTYVYVYIHMCMYIQQPCRVSTLNCCSVIPQYSVIKVKPILILETGSKITNLSMRLKFLCDGLFKITKLKFSDTKVTHPLFPGKYMRTGLLGGNTFQLTFNFSIAVTEDVLCTCTCIYVHTLHIQMYMQTIKLKCH